MGGVRLAFHNGRPDRLAVHIDDHKGVAGRLPREGGCGFTGWGGRGAGGRIFVPIS